MNIKPIRTETDYRAMLAEVERLMKQATTSAAEEDRLEVLSALVEAYEKKHYPIDYPDPIEAIKFIMEQRGLAPKDLVPMIGQPNRVSEILNRKRSLTLAMIRKLHTGLGIPAESLIQETAKAVPARTVRRTTSGKAPTRRAAKPAKQRATRSKAGKGKLVNA